MVDIKHLLRAFFFCKSIHSMNKPTNFFFIRWLRVYNRITVWQDSIKIEYVYVVVGRSMDEKSKEMVVSESWNRICYRFRLLCEWISFISHFFPASFGCPVMKNFFFWSTSNNKKTHSSQETLRVASWHMWQSHLHMKYPQSNDHGIAWSLLANALNRKFHPYPTEIHLWQKPNIPLIGMAFNFSQKFA